MHFVPCKREPEKETLKFEDSFPASFPFATKLHTFDETEGMTVGSRLGVRKPVTDPRKVLSPYYYSLGACAKKIPRMMTSSDRGGLGQSVSLFGLSVGV